MKLAFLALGALPLNYAAHPSNQESSLEVRAYEIEAFEHSLGEREPLEYLQWPQWSSAEGSWEKRKEGWKSRESDPAAKRAFGTRDLAGTVRWDWERRLEDLFELAGLDNDSRLEVEYLEGLPSVLAVTASEASHRFLRVFFDRSKARTEHIVEFEAFLVEGASLDRLAPSGSQTLFAGRELETRLDASMMTSRHNATARIGRVVRLGSVEQRDLLWGYTTEAHADGVTPFPERSIARSGLDLYIDAQPAVLGGYALRIRGQRSSLSTREEFFRFPGGAERTVELPTFRVQREGATATVEDGGGILLGSNAPDGSAWLIRVSSTARPEKLPSFLPTGGLTARGNDLSGRRFFGPTCTGGFLIADDPLLDALLRSTREAAFQPADLRYALDLMEGPEFAPFWIESEIYVGEDVERQERVKLYLEAEAARVEANVAFELRYAEVARALGTELLRRTPNQIAPELSGRVLGCCRMGGLATSVQVVSTAYTSDVNVEIAGRNHPGHPIRSSLYEGTSLELHAAPTGGVTSLLYFRVGPVAGSNLQGA